MKKRTKLIKLTNELCQNGMLPQKAKRKAKEILRNAG